MKLQIITAKKKKKKKKNRNLLSQEVPHPKRYIIARTSGSIAAILPHGSGSIAAILPEVPVVLPERVISGNIARN